MEGKDNQGLLRQIDFGLLVMLYRLSHFDPDNVWREKCFGENPWTAGRYLRAVLDPIGMWWYILSSDLPNPMHILCQSPLVG